MNNQNPTDRWFRGTEPATILFVHDEDIGWDDVTEVDAFSWDDETKRERR